jgi:allantoicase
VTDNEIRRSILEALYKNMKEHNIAIVANRMSMKDIVKQLKIDDQELKYNVEYLVSCQACHAGRDPASKTAWIPACAGMTILGHTTSYG